MLHQTRGRRNAFTVIELMVVIGIIVLLISILIPVVSRVQTAAKTASTSSFIAQLSSAIEQYYQDFKSYPGPLANNEIRRNNYGDAGFWPSGLRTFMWGEPLNPWPTSEFAQIEGEATDGRYRITMSENLVLGLLGGLKIFVDSGFVHLVYDPRLVGKGPLSLNPGQPKAYAPYLEPINLSWQQENGLKTGAYFDEASGPDGADDSIIPEFQDRYSDPMPILYWRAKVGATRPNPAATLSPTDNAVISNDPNLSFGRLGPYDLSQNIGYTEPPSGGRPIGVGKKLPKYVSVNSPPQPANHAAPQHGLRSVDPACTLNNPPPSSLRHLYPYDAYPYFRDPSLSAAQDSTGAQIPRQKDKYILISAGPDRVYGTNDDITNFGSVNP